MVEIKKIAAQFFGSAQKQDSNSALAASLEDLMNQKKGVVFLHIKNKLKTSDQSGDVKSAFKGRGIEMEEIREYCFGDDVRDIDWRVTARKNTPYTKVYAEERDREIYAFLDLSPSMLFGTRKELKSVTASKIAALIGWMAQKNNDRFGAFIFDGEKTWHCRPQNDRANLLAVLKKIEATQKQVLKKQNLKPDWQKTLHSVLKNMKSQAVLFLVSDFADFGEEEKKLLAAVAKKSQLFCVDVYDVLEEKAPPAGEYMIENQGKSLVFDTRSDIFVEEYARFFAEKRANMRDFCQQFGCKWIEVRSDVPIGEQMRVI